ncbi:MAG: hypothetical protein AAGG45_10145 [Pseudomonadota bacterium]
MDKKSERLEVRLSHSDKESFQSACESSGETPSDVIRRFIRRYIRRADSDRLGEGLAALQAMAGRNGLKLAVAGLTICVGLIAVFDMWPRSEAVAHESMQAWPPYERDLFAKYDSDGDGQIRPGDIRPDDSPLFRVLDLDASGTIDVHEFMSIGAMSYMLLQDESVFPDRSPTFSECTGRTDSVNGFRLITFNLRIYDSIMLVDAKYAGHKRDDGRISFSGPDRTVIWDTDRKPCLISMNYGFEPRPRSED